MSKIEKVLISQYDPASQVSEAYRTLRTNLILRDFDHKVRTINIISQNAEESKTTTSLNLGYSLAMLGKKTIVVDMDLRSPAVHRKLNVKNEKGVTDVATGLCSLEEATFKYDENMFVLTAGKMTPFASELVQSHAIKDLIDKLKTLYEYVIVDCPPIGPVSDGLVVSGYCEGTLLCVASGQDDRRDLERINVMAKEYEINILGIVVTRIPRERSSYYYSGYKNKYGKKYGYGNYGKNYGYGYGKYGYGYGKYGYGYGKYGYGKYGYGYGKYGYGKYGSSYGKTYGQEQGVVNEELQIGKKKREQ